MWNIAFYHFNQELNENVRPHLGGSFKGILAIAAVPLEDLHLKHPADHDERHKGQDSQGQLPREDEADDQCRPDTRQGLCHRAQTCTCHLVMQKNVSLFVGRCEWWGFKVLFFSSSKFHSKHFQDLPYDFIASR